MTYHGLLSKGCEACRSRKVKCDEGQPACGRCTRSGRRCPGYRELTTIIFRDENRRIVRRFVKKQSTQRARAANDGNATNENASPPKDVYTEGRPDCRNVGQTTPRISSRGDAEAPTSHHQQKQQSQPDPDNQAIMAMPVVRIGRNEAVCFFHQQFSWETVPMHLASFNWTSHSPALLSTTTALGFAMLSFARCLPSLKHKAYAEYGSALQLVNRLLSKRATARLDSTLAVVVLMAFFEIFTARSAPSMESWLNHASGAASILGIRGPSQLESPLGYQLFLETKGMVLAASLIYKTAVPQILSDYTQVAMERKTPSEAHAGRIFIILAELAKLRAAIKSRTITNPLEIRRTAHSIESQLHHWKTMLPPGWEYETVTLKDSDGAVETRCGKIRPYGGCYFVYNKSAAHVAVGLMNYFISEILLGEVLLNIAHSEFWENPQGRHTISRTKCLAVRRTMDLMAEAICASIPWLLRSDPSTATDESLGLEGGCMILLPLWFAACVEGADHPLRRNAVFLFDIVAQKVGIAHASFYMQELAHMKGMAEWLDDPSPEVLIMKSLVG